MVDGARPATHLAASERRSSPVALKPRIQNDVTPRPRRRTLVQPGRQFGGNGLNKPLECSLRRNDEMAVVAP